MLSMCMFDFVVVVNGNGQNGIHVKPISVWGGTKLYALLLRCLTVVNLLPVLLLLDYFCHQSDTSWLHRLFWATSQARCQRCRAVWWDSLLAPTVWRLPVTMNATLVVQCHHGFFIERLLFVCLHTDKRWRHGTVALSSETMSTESGQRMDCKQIK